MARAHSLSSSRPLVAHVFNSSVVSGPETLVLPALADLGFPVTVLFLVEERLGEAGRAPVRYASELRLDAVEVVVRARFDRSAIAALAALLDQLRPRLVHAHDVKASAYVLAAARRAGTRAALVSTHHGVRGRPDARSRLYEIFYTRALLPRFDLVLAVSAEDERLLRRRGLERVALHRNGIDAPRVDPDRRAEAAAAARRAWGVEVAPGELLLGAVGRLSPEKGHDRLLAWLAALDRLADAGRAPPWSCLLFGTGPLASALAERARALGLDRRLRWMGWRAEVGHEMAGFDLLLSASRAEGLPVSLLEAGWAATPVAATVVGGVADVLGDPPAGLALAPGEPPARAAERLGALLLSPERRAVLGRALQARVMTAFSRRAWLDRLRELYAPLLSSGR